MSLLVHLLHALGLAALGVHVSSLGELADIFPLRSFSLHHLSRCFVPAFWWSPFFWCATLTRWIPPELSVALWIHAFVCCLGALVILRQPCENGDKLRHATVEKMSGIVRGRFCTPCFCTAVVGFRYLHGRYSSGA